MSLGLGLPLARLYAKHFGGSLRLTPVEAAGLAGMKTCACYMYMYMYTRERMPADSV